MSSKIAQPSTFHTELTDERLTLIGEQLLEVRYETLREMQSQYDDNYTRETAVFGRSKNMLVQLALSKRFQWLDVLNAGMDCTIAIGSVPVRFFRDDPDTPEKRGFFRRNAVDQLFETDETLPVLWRFVVESRFGDDGEDHVYFNGYNALQEKVCEWVLRSGTTILHSVGSAVPTATPLAAPKIDVRVDEDKDRLAGHDQ